MISFLTIHSDCNEANESSMTWQIRKDNRRCGQLQLKHVGETVWVRITDLEDSLRNDGEFVDVLTQRIIVNEHPKWIRIGTYPKELIPWLRNAMYYPKGRSYQRAVEPWRLALPDFIFDRRGYLINQGEMKQISFGAFNTRDKGCGWIAAYNLFKMNGMEKPMKEVARALDQKAIFQEIAGENIFTLNAYLRAEGLPVSFTGFTRANVIRAMEHSSSGILLYTHKKGAHYTAYQRAEKGRFHFYNAVYGLRYQEMTPEAFLEKYSIPISYMVITVPTSQNNE